MKILIVFYSLYGHVYEMARSVAEGVKEAGVEPIIKRVPETLPEDVLEVMGALDFQESIAPVPVATPENLAEADAIIFGTPTRFGNMCGQMRQFLDATGALWQRGALVGKVGSVFTSTATQHGGQESTLLSFHISLLHYGMIIAGLPYAFTGQMTMDEISGGTPYGATTIASGDGSRIPSKNERDGARYQGKYVAEIALKLNK